MAEVGLLPFARIALQVAKAVLPRYRSRFSKHQFTQPQLLAILCLMRYEDLSRGRSTARRTPRIASGAGAHQRTRFHDLVPLPAATGRSNHRPGGRRDGTSVARHAPQRPATSPRGSGRHGFVARSRQHVFCPSPASPWPKAAAVAALVEVGDRGRFGSAVPAVANGTTRTVERLRESAHRRRNGGAANSHRAGAGRCGVRQ